MDQTEQDVQLVHGECTLSQAQHRVRDKNARQQDDELMANRHEVVQRECQFQERQTRVEDLEQRSQSALVTGLEQSDELRELYDCDTTVTKADENEMVVPVDMLIGAQAISRPEESRTGSQPSQCMPPASGKDLCPGRKDEKGENGDGTRPPDGVAEGSSTLVVTFATWAPGRDLVRGWGSSFFDNVDPHRCPQCIRCTRIFGGRRCHLLSQERAPLMARLSRYMFQSSYVIVCTGSVCQHRWCGQSVPCRCRARGGRHTRPSCPLARDRVLCRARGRGSLVLFA